MHSGVICFNSFYAEALKGIAWKDINTKFKNDLNKTVDYIHLILEEKKVSIEDFLKEVEDIQKQIEVVDLSLLGKRTKPLAGY